MFQEKIVQVGIELSTYNKLQLPDGRVNHCTTESNEV